MLRPLPCAALTGGHPGFKGGGVTYGHSLKRGLSCMLVYGSTNKFHSGIIPNWRSATLLNSVLLTRPSAAASDGQQVWQPPVQKHFRCCNPSSDPKHPGTNINIGRETEEEGENTTNTIYRKQYIIKRIPSPRKNNKTLTSPQRGKWRKWVCFYSMSK